MDHLNLSLGDEFRPRCYGNNFDPTAKDYDFHTFPGTVDAGWDIDNRCYLKPTTSAAESQESLNIFLQSWLFFGLISAVIGHTTWQKGFEHEFMTRDGDYIDTTRLGDFLNNWETGEKESSDGRIIRMFRSQVALDRAHDIVKTLCSSDGKMAKNPERSALKVNERLGLSLMVLGETLATAKFKISERVGFRIRGWHTDATEGWGTPPCVTKTMEDNGWCRRKVESLKGQLRSHATALLSAYKSQVEIEGKASQKHTDCTIHECRVRYTNLDGTYETTHHPTCIEEGTREDCIMTGPNPDELAECIEKGFIPLLEYKQDTKEVKIVKHKPHMPYATISHVWSGGYGNVQENKMWSCQLDSFMNLITNITNKKSGPNRVRAPPREPFFWIDTLAIPVRKSSKTERRKAIQKIHEIYTNAKFTIVVDNDLNKTSAGSKYQDIAMKILASAWMRRLWTLQEAYLSKKLLFAFADNQLKNIDDIEEMYPEADNILSSNIPTAARIYFHNLLGSNRTARINKTTLPRGHGFLASVWRAAQWRTTDHPEHETLALATLLHVDYEDAEYLASAGDVQWSIQPKSKKELEEMMKELWVLLHETCPGAIPPGIIFLPGERLPIKDFGWAPRTWMSGQDVDYPDPLSYMPSAAEFVEGKGLRVQYPGFLLHFKSADSVLLPKQTSIEFPSDSSLLEWYEVEQADSKTNILPATGKLMEVGEYQIAIILCRPKPREQREIALLVKVVKPVTQRDLYEQTSRTIYQSEIICRIRIRRQGKIDYATKLDQFNRQAVSGNDQDVFICGEALDSDQEWFVDGPSEFTRVAGVGLSGAAIYSSSTHDVGRGLEPQIPGANPPRDTRAPQMSQGDMLPNTGTILTVDDDVRRNDPEEVVSPIASNVGEVAGEQLALPLTDVSASPRADPRRMQTMPLPNEPQRGRIRGWFGRFAAREV